MRWQISIQFYSPAPVERELELRVLTWDVKDPKWANLPLLVFCLGCSIRVQPGRQFWITPTGAGPTTKLGGGMSVFTHFVHYSGAYRPRCMVWGCSVYSQKRKYSFFMAWIHNFRKKIVFGTPIPMQFYFRLCNIPVAINSK